MKVDFVQIVKEALEGAEGLLAGDANEWPRARAGLLLIRSALNGSAAPAECVAQLDEFLRVNEPLYLARERTKH